MKIVTANQGSIAAAGDISITINNHHGADHTGFLKRLITALGIPEADLPSTWTDRLDDRSAEEKMLNLIMLAKSSALGPSTGYDPYFTEQHCIESRIRSAIKSLRNQEYLQASKSFQYVLSIGAPDAIKPKLVYDYFISGYVGYSLVSNIDALRAIISDVRTQFHGYLDQGTDILIVDAHQEVATRQLDDAMLFENEAMLMELIRKYGHENVSCLNLLGLLYRRLGERKSQGESRQLRLEQALDVFMRLSKLTNHMSVEATNNWAITLIRHYELTGHPVSLDEAEGLLTRINFQPREPLPLGDFLSLPKALNNLGNVYKQRLTRTGDAHAYGQAIARYDQTAQFWNETSSPYEWAMVQKNKADARCAYMEMQGYHEAMAREALQEIEASMRYRTKENAPYQYQRSLDVKLRIENLKSVQPNK